MIIVSIQLDLSKLAQIKKDLLQWFSNKGSIDSRLFRRLLKIN
jgi:hypothetical protein